MLDLSEIGHIHFLSCPAQRRVERFGIGLASLLAKSEGERLERFCSAARISARSDKSGEALRATRRSGARSATERQN
jgi:hypothetical protein